MIAAMGKVCLVILAAIALFNCKTNTGESNRNKIVGDGVPNKNLSIPFLYTTYFDSIGPALSADYNGDAVIDTAFAVHVRSSAALATAPFAKSTIDSTSPYEELCGGWCVYVSLSDTSMKPLEWKGIYFCGQQARVQEFNWVGEAKLDTLPYPDLRASAGKAFSHVISLFSQAGIEVYLYYTGMEFKIYEPDEEP
jgi:hypothetical protein